MYISPSLALRLDQLQNKLIYALQNGATIQDDLWTYLQASENQLIQLMTSPTPPGPTAPGNIEVSWMLYYLNYHTKGTLHKILVFLGMPKSKITPDDWTKWYAVWQGPGVLMGDGSLVSTAPCAVVDIGWSIAFLAYLFVYLKWTTPYPFGNTPANLTISKSGSFKMALFGDWGSGNYTDGNLPSSPSVIISQQIKNMNPDVSVHLGDVYYVGYALEEEINLLGNWPTAPLGNFTLNSNHEMYDAANGYFDTALASPVFEGQKNTSYFQVQYGNWIIVGLDSAYYDQSTLDMAGAITDQAQIDFLNQIGQQQGKKIMVLTHHNPLDTTGQNQQPLWSQVVNALGKAPDYWYWGHVHNGMVYTSASAGGNTKCRCLGNAAIPIGDAEWLKVSMNKTVSFYTNKPLTNPTPNQKLRVMNGFAMLEFTPTDVKEVWYYQDGSQAWSS